MRMGTSEGVIVDGAAICAARMRRPHSRGALTWLHTVATGRNGAPLVIINQGQGGGDGRTKTDGPRAAGGVGPAGRGGGSTGSRSLRILRVTRLGDRHHQLQR